MRHGIWAAFAITAVATACNDVDTSRGVDRSTRSERVSEADEIVVTASRMRRDDVSGAPAPRSEAGTDLYLAFEYEAELEAPADAVAPLMSQHEATCRDAGPNICVVFGSDRSQFDGEVSGSLNLRAEPKWLSTFRAGLSKDAEAAGGRLISTSMSVDDLSREIIDTEARLNARRTLRDRLQALLETREGTVDELLKVERELARVQGELDAAASRLKVMRLRVDMSVLTLHYESESQPVERGVLTPLANARDEIAYVFFESVAAVILFISGALAPLLFIGVPALFGLRWFVRQLRKPN